MIEKAISEGNEKAKPIISKGESEAKEILNISKSKKDSAVNLVIERIVKVNGNS